MSTALAILRECKGVTVERKKAERNPWDSGPDRYNESFYLDGDIELPNRDIFIEITSTATKGTIGRVVDIETETYLANNDLEPDGKRLKLTSYGHTFIYEVDGRTQKGRIASEYTVLLFGPQVTKYVRNVKKHKKVKIKNPVNKFKQELQRGDWVIGVKMSGKSLGIGRITRWTNKSVWGVTGEDLDDKSKEFLFASIKETFTMPNDEHVALLTMAVLKGWKGE